LLYAIEFRPTKQHANADDLSRLPLGTRKEAALSINTLMIGQIQAMLVTTVQIQATTCQRPFTEQSFEEGWRMKVSDNFSNAKMNCTLKVVAYYAIIPEKFC